LKATLSVKFWVMLCKDYTIVFDQDFQTMFKN